jgi:serine/threonine protein kinase
MYAVKVIAKAQVKKKPFLQKYIEQEIDIMKKLNHKNIVHQDAALDTPDFILIVLEYCDQGNLLTYQARLPGKTFPIEQALRVLVEVLKGLKCIHEKNFIHRDIKSENILLKK